MLLFVYGCQFSACYPRSCSCKRVLEVSGIYVLERAPKIISENGGRRGYGLEMGDCDTFEYLIFVYLLLDQHRQNRIVSLSYEVKYHIHMNGSKHDAWKIDNCDSLPLAHSSSLSISPNSPIFRRDTVYKYYARSTTDG